MKYMGLGVLDLVPQADYWDQALAWNDSGHGCNSGSLSIGRVLFGREYSL